MYIHSRNDPRVIKCFLLFYVFHNSIWKIFYESSFVSYSNNQAQNMGRYTDLAYCIGCIVLYILKKYWKHQIQCIFSACNLHVIASWFSCLSPTNLCNLHTLAGVASSLQIWAKCHGLHREIMCFYNCISKISYWKLLLSRLNSFGACFVIVC